MIGGEKGVGPGLSERQVGCFERGLAKLLTTQSAVEALNESLVVLAIRAGDDVLAGVLVDHFQKRALEFGASVGLQGLDGAGASGQFLKGCLAISRSQAGAHEDEALAGVGIDGGEGEDLAQIEGVHLHCLARCLAPLGGLSFSCARVLGQLLVLPEQAIDGAQAQPDTFLTQQIHDLLPASSPDTLGGDSARAGPHNHAPCAACGLSSPPDSV